MAIIEQTLDCVNLESKAAPSQSCLAAPPSSAQLLAAPQRTAG